MQEFDPRWTEDEAANYLRITKFWLQKLRSRGGHGPAFEYVGRSVRYRKSALDTYVEENTRKRLQEQFKVVYPKKVKP